MMLTALHHGMVLVGVPYTVQEISITTTGGSPYGASTVAGPKGDQMPNELDLKVASILGQRVAEIAGKLKAE